MTKEQILLTTEYMASLLLSLQGGTDPKPLPAGITLADVYALSRKHALAAATYSALSPILSDADIPDALRSSWVKESELATVQHLRQSTAYSEITSALTAEKIPFLTIKGFLLKELWSHPELRVMSDIDIVVSAESFEHAEHILLSLGYASAHTDALHSSYIKSRFVNVELHRALYDGATETFADWTPRAENLYWHEMPAEDFILFFLRHAYKHYESGGCGVRTLFDLYLLFEKYGRPADNVSLTEKICTANLMDFCNIMTDLVDRLFCGAVNTSSDDALLYIATGGTYGSFDNKVSYSINKKGSRTRHILSRIFPSYKTMTERYLWVARCPLLLPIAYLVRLITSVFNGSAHREMQIINKTKAK